MAPIRAYTAPVKTAITRHGSHITRVAVRVAALPDGPLAQCAVLHLADARSYHARAIAALGTKDYAAALGLLAQSRIFATAASRLARAIVHTTAATPTN